MNGSALLGGVVRSVPNQWTLKEQPRLPVDPSAAVGQERAEPGVGVVADGHVGHVQIRLSGQL